MPMIDLTLTPQSDPLSLYRYRDGLYAADLLGAALVGLDFFTWLAEHPSDKETLCRALEITERPTDVMLTLFTAMGLVQKTEGVFRVTSTAREFLVRGSPWFMGPYYAALKERPVCRDYLKVLRTGKPANWGSFQDTKDWTKAMEEDAFAKEFTAAMDCRGLYLAPALAKAVSGEGRTRLLDIAGGSGIYACAMVAHYEQLQATVLEKPPVDRVTRRAVAERGLAARVSVHVADMFAQELPSGFDLHLFSNVLHDWDEPVVKQLLAKSFRALAPGGTLLIHDMHLNEDKSGPLPVAEYSALLMHATEGKCYSLGELRRYFGEIGFVDCRFSPTVADRSVVTARKR
jgi:SAM-dependent methyltransferase